LWSLVGLVVLLLAGGGVVIGGSYLWFHHVVVQANSRVSPAAKTALSTKPQSTLVSVAPPAPESPDAMDILVLGSDNRGNETNGRSDTLMLVHVDPGENFMSILSIPRDLRVDIPGRGLDKINAAYAYGGAALSISTVKELTGIDINHYVEIGFGAFEDLTNALGGVYVDVDHRYYNDDPAYELIKLSPGYQLLGGHDALEYVRFRHDQNADFGRIERQQRFLVALREQATAMGPGLVFKLPSLVNALFRNVGTDLSANDVLKLAYWGAKLNGDRIRQISITGSTPTINGISYVEASPEAIRQAVTDFLTPPSAASVSESGGSPTGASASSTGSSTASTQALQPDLSRVTLDVVNGTGRPGINQAIVNWFKSLAATVASSSEASHSPLQKTTVGYPSGEYSTARLVARAVDADSVTFDRSLSRVTVTLGEGFALPAAFTPPATPETIPNASEWKALATMISFPLEAPGYIPADYTYEDRMPKKGGTYGVKVGSGTQPALRMVYQYQKTDQYLGITETTWLDAPVASKGDEVQHDGVTFTVVGTSQDVDHVWWKKDGVLYWVSNTLSYDLTKKDLLAMAESMIDIPKP
jgi:LCP family protein required for cell wall assembly